MRDHRFHRRPVDGSSGALGHEEPGGNGPVSGEGLHIGQRGLGMYRDRLHFERPDDHLLCLDAWSGEVEWDVQIADVKLGYWITMALLIMKNHVLAGVSGDFNDLHGFIDSFDPDIGKLRGNGMRCRSRANRA